MSEKPENIAPNPSPYQIAAPPGWYPMPPEAAWGEENEPEIDIMEYARLLWAKKWLIVAVLVATVVFGTAWSMTADGLRAIATWTSSAKSSSRSYYAARAAV